MSIEEGVKCPECGQAVVPRLLFTGERSPITYRKAQHICPFCGVIMYKTGGGVNWMAVVILLTILGLCTLVLLFGVRQAH
jgi:ribosomal protein S27E